MSEYKGVTVTKDVGYQVPDEYLKSVIKSFPSCYGMVGINKGSMEIEVIRDAADLKSQRELNKATEKSLIVFHFANFPEGYLDDAMQPFRLLVGQDGKTGILACTIVGDFKHHLPKDSRQSPEFWTATNALLPKMQQIHRLVKGDLKLFHEELSSDIMKKEINGLIGPQGGQITLVMVGPPKTGENYPTLIVMHFQKSLPTFKKFTWGDTSDVLDYVTGIAQEVVQEKITKPRSKFLPLDDAPTEVEEEEDADVTKDDVPITAAKEQPKQSASADKSNTIDKKIKLSDGSTVVRRMAEGVAHYWWTPPVGITKRSQLRKLYKFECHRTLTNRELDTRMSVEVKEPTRYAGLFKDVLGELLHQRDSRNGSDAPRSKPAEVTEKSPAKDAATGKDVVTTVAESKKPKDIPADTGSEIYTVLNKKSLYDINKYLKTLDKGGQAIINPELWQGLEDTQKFIKEIGYPGLEATFGWSDEVRFNLAKIDPKSMVIWTNGLLSVIHNLEKEIEGLTDTDVDKGDALPQRSFKKKVA